MRLHSLYIYWYVKIYLTLFCLLYTIIQDELADGVNANPRESGRDARRRRRRLYRDDKGPFVLEIDDETDEDIMSVLLEEQLPRGIRLTVSFDHCLMNANEMMIIIY